MQGSSRATRARATSAQMPRTRVEPGPLPRRPVRACESQDLMHHGWYLQPSAASEVGQLPLADASGWGGSDRIKASISFAGFYLNAANTMRRSTSSCKGGTSAPSHAGLPRLRRLRRHRVAHPWAPVERAALVDGRCRRGRRSGCVVGRCLQLVHRRRNPSFSDDPGAHDSSSIPADHAARRDRTHRVGAVMALEPATESATGPRSVVRADQHAHGAGGPSVCNSTNLILATGAVVDSTMTHGDSSSCGSIRCQPRPRARSAATRSPQHRPGSRPRSCTRTVRSRASAASADRWSAPTRCARERKHRVHVQRP